MTLEALPDDWCVDMTVKDESTQNAARWLLESHGCNKTWLVEHYDKNTDRDIYRMYGRRLDATG